MAASVKHFSNSKQCKPLKYPREKEEAMSVGIYMLQTWAIFGVQKCQLLRGVTAFLLAEKDFKKCSEKWQAKQLSAAAIQ
jgi:hypothetical protein